MDRTPAPTATSYHRCQNCHGPTGVRRRPDDTRTVTCGSRCHNAVEIARMRSDLAAAGGLSPGWRARLAAARDELDETA